MVFEAADATSGADGHFPRPGARACPNRRFPAQPVPGLSTTDGDTFRATVGGIPEPIRLIGMDTLEVVEPECGATVCRRQIAKTRHGLLAARQIGFAGPGLASLPKCAEISTRQRRNPPTL